MSSMGRKLIKRLKGFSETLAEGKDLTKRYTCRTVKFNLEPQPFGPEAVKQAREALSASQAIFAQFLGVSTNTVQDWEQGVKKPRGSACRLMDEIRRNPTYWQDRLKALAVPVGDVE